MPFTLKSLKIDIFRLLMTLALVATFVGCDQVTKYIARQNLAPFQAVTVIQNTVYLQYAENSGAALSLGAALSQGIRFWLLVVTAGAILLALLVYLLFHGPALSPARIVALSLIIGGGMGNLIDRLFNGGRVIDFMLISIGKYHTGIFNLADFSVLLGVVLLFFQLLLLRRTKPTPGTT